MIQSFRHKGLRRFYETGSLRDSAASRQAAAHAVGGARYRQVLDDMSVAGFRLHALKGEEKGRWSIWVMAIGANV